MSAPKQIIELVERFNEQREAYLSPHYNEAQLRQEFLNPFFEALDWDIHNKRGYAEAYKEVVHEASVKVGIETKAPDYSFRIGGTRKFFVEAKKPSVNIHDDPAPAFQLRRYAWSAKLPLSILSNFAELAVYDCRVKPLQSDKAAKSCTLYLTVDDYVEHWDEIASIFSKDAVLKGSFDKYAVGKGKKGTAEVDNTFLEEIESWRDALARNIALRNSSLTQAELNFSVQQTIGRIIFLRICEDRGIESYGRLRGLLNGSNVYPRLRQLFHDADDRYNSGLFHFRKESGRGKPDSLTLGLEIDDKVLKDILENLYYPESPYEFSVLPADILGQVYEQFLGKVIRLTAGGHAKVEDKPQIKKAGGVYYTPTYIVDYIVKNTVGKLLEGKKPEKVAKLKILDPACGSGSFLIGAYQYLLDWYLHWYSENEPEKHVKGRSPKIFKGQGNVWRLTTAERKRILLNNVYGVDIDPQAVEVTKLSLLLKVLEEESAETLGKNWEMFHERALPDLDNNIKCGNSLVGPDYYDGKFDFDNEERDRINAFDWNHEFREIFEGSGFDTVIGNPPYSYRNATEDALRPYYSEKYASAEGNFDLYKFFIERSLSLIRPEGIVGFIVSATFLIQATFSRLRELIVSSAKILNLSPLGPGVFAKATVDTTILVLQRTKSNVGHRIAVHIPPIPADLPNSSPLLIPQDRFKKNEGFVFDYKLSEKAGEIVKRLFDSFPLIEKGYEFGVGINTGFIRGELVANKKVDRRYHAMVAGDGISRYGRVRAEGWIMYDKEYVKSRGELGRTLPAEHLLNTEKILVVRTRNLSLSRRIIATLDRDRVYNLNRLSNIVARPGYLLTGLLGILNSSLFNWLYSTRFFDYEIKPVYLRQSPLADSNNKQLIALVERMLALNAGLLSSKTSHETTLLIRQIDATDKQIDNLVYELYDLTEGEIKIVDGND